MDGGGRHGTAAVRRRSAWLVALPLVIAGSLTAHQLAYALVAGDRAGAVLRETGHGYLDRLPAGALLGTVCLLIGLVLAGLDRLHERSGRPVPLWAVACAPAVGFALQEHVERFAASGHIPWTAAAEATFLVGLALQAPFALAAYAVARRLVRAAVALAATLVAAVPAPRRTPRIPFRRAAEASPPKVGIAYRCAPRGPPEPSIA